MENNSQAIGIKGIVRNQTKIGVQDGQCDDIVNLRFKDGSWRVADDGKVMLDADNGVPFKSTDYSQLYVHTNVYHNLLGVKRGKLYWFANIGADGESFTYVEDGNGVPSPVEICDVQGDVTIVQNGHLITIISLVSSDTTPLPLADSSQSEERISYAIFVTGTDEYKVLNVNANGEQTDRGLYPFGSVHFNLHRNVDKTLVDREYVSLNTSSLNGTFNGDYNVKKEELFGALNIDFCRNKAKSMYGEQTKNNLFTRPFLACVAIKLYDGTYSFASAPILLNPSEKSNDPEVIYGNERTAYIEGQYENGEIFRGKDGMWYKSEVVQADTTEFSNEDYVFFPESDALNLNKLGEVRCVASNKSLSNQDGLSFFYRSKNPPVFSAGSYTSHNDVSATHYFALFGYDLVVTIEQINFIKNYPDIFKSFCIFITPQVDIYDFNNSNNEVNEASDILDIKWYSRYECITYYKPKKREKEQIVNDLIKSQFFLLKEYSITALDNLYENPIVDLTQIEDKGVLENLVTKDKLPIEVTDRKSFFPQVLYSYNQKLHIANYQSKQFHGFPIDSFHLNNHLVIKNKGGYLFNVLPNIEISEDDQYNQYDRNKYMFLSHCSTATYEQYIQAAKDKGYCFASIRVIIDAQQGDQQVVRYIQPYEAHKFTNGDNANFVESLGALLTFPDHRAKEMEIAVISLHEGKVYRRSKTFNLKPHTYLNIAYYIDPQLKPIDLPIVGSSTGVSFDDFISSNQIGLFVTPSERNNTEDYPNGLKVSLTNNPFTFPYESTYQVGSSEIVALMSNAVAVGTGQTGAAPLYVFCKDGIYALLVDSTGEMTYSNARIIARDVCNNAKSITPIDSGVVFTTDRGIMSIEGSEVVEIGSAAEGDVFDITDAADKAKKIMFNAFTMQKLAEFPQSLVDNTDFLTYLKGAIVNYNHNERELMVSNPDKDYTYVMDRNGNWSRRAFTAQEYVNNYPTSYRIDKSGKLYKVDTDDNDTNQVYLLSNVIKLGTIAFKQAYRLVVRGYFETSSVAYGEINGVYVKVVGSFIDRMKGGESLHMTYITQYGQSMWVDVDDNNRVLNGAIQILDPVTNEDITYSVVSVNSGQYYRVVKSYETVGCYVFGSYDGRQWSLLGGNEKGGMFTDIGCKIAHTDIRFLRVCLAGKLSKNTRIDYIEVSAEGSALNGKLR